MWECRLGGDRLLDESREDVIRRYEERQSLAMLAKWAGTFSTTILRYLCKWEIKHDLPGYVYDLTVE